MSDIQSKKTLINEIYKLLDETNKPLAPILRRAIRLAELCKKEEYRLLFDAHLDGINLKEQGRIKKWTDKNKIPAWNITDVFLLDRSGSNEKVYPHPIEELEFILINTTETKNTLFTNNYHKEALQLFQQEKDCRNVLIKTRNRITFFLREVEADIRDEIEFLREVGKGMSNYAEKEYRILKKIYDISEGQPEEWVMIDELEESLGMTLSEINPVIIDLEDRKGLIGSVEQAVWILPAGIEEIEKTTKTPEQSTNNFPPYIFNNTFNAPVTGVQQGQNNTQNNTQNLNADFTIAIEKLLILVESSSLSQLEKIKTKSNIQTIKDLSELDKTPEVLAEANSRIEAVKDVISTTADMTSLGMVLIQILQAAFVS